MKELSASDITKKAIQILNERGVEAWRQANLTYGNRKGIATPGVPDILGYERASGRFIVVEVKKNGDTIKEAQKAFLNKVKASGARAYIARQVGSEVMLVEW